MKFATTSITTARAVSATSAVAAPVKARSDFERGPSLGQTDRAFTGAATNERRRWDLGLFVVVLLGLNFPLLHGRFVESLIFLSEPVQAGEWWRVLAHPFVHVSWYHLLLDGAAFLMLYDGLDQKSVMGRLFYVVLSGAGSLFFSLWAAPMVQSYGLCGLSGVAHGLMAISGLEMMTAQPSPKTARRTGAFFLLMVVLKSAVEALTGRAFFTFLHFGLLGTPIAVCHAGGVLGGIVAFLSWQCVVTKISREKLSTSNLQLSTFN